MKVIITAQGLINWTVTRDAAVQHMGTSMVDFGLGRPEPARRCPGCGRTLPTACMHLDHINAQATHAVALQQRGQILDVVDAANPTIPSAHYAGYIEGGLAYIQELGTGPATSRYGRAVTRTAINAKGLNALTAWENDLANLQFLCVQCNTAKGDRHFNVHFPMQVTQPLA